MRFTVNSDIYKDAVAFIERMLPKNSTQPILGGILIEAQGEKATLSVFNYEVSAKIEIKAAIDLPGQALVPGSLMGKIVKTLPNQDILLDLDENTINLKCGTSNFQIPAMPAEEFPTLPSLSTITGVVPTDKFAEAVHQITMAASREDVTPVLTSVKFATTKDHLMLTATDRYRIAIRGVDWQSETEEEINALVPSAFLTEVGNKTFSDVKHIQVAMTDGDGRELIGFIADNKTVTSQLVKGIYPPVERLFNNEENHFAVINTDDLRNALKRIMAVIEQNDPVKFIFKEGSVLLQAQGSETAKAEEKVDVHLQGEEIVISLRGKFVIDGLNGTNSEFTKIIFSNSGSDRPGAVMFKAQNSDTGADEYAFKYLLQPTLLSR